MVWQSLGKFVMDGDPVGDILSKFRDGMEKMCRPIIDRNFGVRRAMLWQPRKI
jgi:hypothetical protein